MPERGKLPFGFGSAPMAGGVSLTQAAAEDMLREGHFPPVTLAVEAFPGDGAALQLMNAPILASRGMRRWSGGV